MKILKKVLKVSIGVVCTCMLCVSLVMAGNFTCTSSSCGSLDFRCSKNVQIRCNSGGQSYAAISDHSSGDKVYGLSSNSSIIYYKKKSDLNITVGQHYDQDPSTSDSSAFSDWSSL